MPPYSKSIPSPTGSEHFTRYFISAFAVFGSAANHFLKWSSTSEFGCRPFSPRRFGGMPLKMPHAFGSIVAVGATTKIGVVVEVVVVVPVAGFVEVVVVYGIPVIGTVEVVCVYAIPVIGSVQVVCVYAIPVAGSVQVVCVYAIPVAGSVQLVVVYVIPVVGSVEVGAGAMARSRPRHASLSPTAIRPFSLSSSAGSCMRTAANLEAGAGRPLPHAAVSASSAAAIRL